MRPLYRIPPRGVVLFHFWPSLCSQKVRLALAEKGVVYEGRLVNIGPPLENYDPDYVRLNPGAVVPTLVVDGEVICDSMRIMHEVDHRFDGPSLLPDEPIVREQVERLLRLQNEFPFREYSYGTLQGFLRLMTRGSMRMRQRRLRRMRARAPDLAAAYDRKLADLANWDRTIRDRAAIDDIERRAEALLDELEAALAEHPFLGGTHYSLADVAWTIILARLHMAGHQRWWESGRRPRVAAWVERMRARPSYRAATVWDRLHPDVMVPLVARFVLPRLAIAIAVIAAVGLAIGSLP